MDDSQGPSWDLDSDEIGSIESEDLSENRPNQWEKHVSTWESLTVEERQTYYAMEELEGKNLAAHLYNAFAMKRRAMDPATAQSMMVKMVDGEETLCELPSAWTEWPMRKKYLPPGGLFPKEDDGNERFTFRRKEKKMPSTELEEELTATVLRLAKERYNRRSILGSPSPSVQDCASATPDSQDESEDELSQPASLPRETETLSESEGSQHEDEESGSEGEDAESRRVENDATYKPAISADDELSSEILRPSIRHIITLLDRTLTIIDDGSVSSKKDRRGKERDPELDFNLNPELEYDTNDGLESDMGRGLAFVRNTGWETESETEWELGSGLKSSRKTNRPRSRPTRSPQAGEKHLPSIEQPETRSPRTRGLPGNAHTPREGETQEEMQHSGARQGHRRTYSTAAAEDAAFEAWLQEGDKGTELERARLREEFEKGSEEGLEEGSEEGSEEYSEEGSGEESEEEPEEDSGEESEKSSSDGSESDEDLADWKTVIGAAMLAGFPEDVIARTTQRCVKLFDPSLAGLSVDQVIFSVQSDTSSTPSQPSSPRSPPASESASTLMQRRESSDRESPARPKPSTPAAAPSGLSSSGEAAVVFCPVSACKFARSGFSRRGNFRRHMERAHRGHVLEGGVMAAMHVHGSPKPVNLESSGEEFERKRKRKRNRKRSVSPEDGDGDGDGDNEMDNAEP